jgi:hypothetical protein
LSGSLEQIDIARLVTHTDEIDNMPLDEPIVVPHLCLREIVAHTIVSEDEA